MHMELKIHCFFFKCVIYSLFKLKAIYTCTVLALRSSFRPLAELKNNSVQ